MKKAIIFARVSTLRQEKEGLSLNEIQLPRLREYASRKEFEVVHEFVFSETADAKMRKKFDEMVKFLRQDQSIKAIIAFRVDRITRNYRDHVSMDIMRLEYDKELHFVADGLVLTKDSRANDIQDWDLKAFLAKQQINRLRDDALNTIETKLSKGELPGPARYGYKNITVGPRQKDVIPDSFKAGVVRKAFELYATGVYSMSQVVKYLKDNFRVNMSKGQLDAILKNPFYYGLILHKGKEYPHRYQPLIDKALFDQVQAVKAGYSKKKYKYAGLPYIYRGLIKCKECGCTITVEQKKGRYIYYHCTEFKGKHNAAWIEEQELTDHFSLIFNRMKIPDSEIKLLLERFKAAHGAQIEFYKTQSAHFQAEITKYQNRIERLYVDQLDERITKDVYDKFYKEFRQEQQNYQNKLNQLQKIDDSYYITVDTILNIASKAEELFRSSEMDQKREILNLVLSNLYISEGKLEYTVNRPFDSILNCSTRKEWLPG